MERVRKGKERMAEGRKAGKGQCRDGKGVEGNGGNGKDWEGQGSVGEKMGRAWKEWKGCGRDRKGRKGMGRAGKVRGWGRRLVHCYGKFNVLAPVWSQRCQRQDFYCICYCHTGGSSPSDP